MDTDDTSPRRVRSLADVVEMLRDLDRRMRLIEVHLMVRAKQGPLLDSSGKRPRGRPPGSRNLPKISVGKPLFAENALDQQQMIAMSVIEGWVIRAKRRRPKEMPPLLSAIVDDDSQWYPLGGRPYNGVRSWDSLRGLRDYAKVCGELPALAETIKRAERLPVDDPQALVRGLKLVEEFLMILPRTVPARLLPAA